MLGGVGGDAFITASMERKHMIPLNQEAEVMFRNKYICKLVHTQWYCFVFVLYIQDYLLNVNGMSSTEMMAWLR